jgi:Kef-type K+ transport system membrane component KefB
VVDVLSVETFLFTVATILVAAKLFGDLAQRIGQPAVLGELIAGVLLGASVLGVVPHDGPLHDVIGLLAEIGVVILLFEIGLETDLREMFRVGKSAASVAIVGVVVPFALGFGFWMILQPDVSAGPNGATLTLTAVFVGATLTATSVGITSRVLADIKQLGTREARIIMGAAIVDDVLGLVILAIVSGLVAGATLTLFGIGLKFAIAIGFLVTAVVLGRWIMPHVFERIDRSGVRGILVVSAFSFALALAALASVVGSAMIIGAFAAGIILSSTNQFDFITERITPIADIFAPIFFVYVGSAVDASLLNPFSPRFDASLIMIAGALLVVAVVGKIVAGYAIRPGRNARLNRLAIGIGMIPRGEVGLIFAHLGLDSGVIGPEGFNVIVLVVMLTTFLAPPLLKQVFIGRQRQVPVVEEGTT